MPSVTISASEDKVHYNTTKCGNEDVTRKNRYFYRLETTMNNEEHLSKYVK